MRANPASSAPITTGLRSVRGREARDHLRALGSRVDNYGCAAPSRSIPPTSPPPWPGGRGPQAVRGTRSARLRRRGRDDDRRQQGAGGARRLRRRPYAAARPSAATRPEGDEGQPDARADPRRSRWSTSGSRSQFQGGPRLPKVARSSTSWGGEFLVASLRDVSCPF